MIRDIIHVCLSRPLVKKYLPKILKSHKFTKKSVIESVKITPTVKFQSKQNNSKHMDDYYKEFLRETL